MQTYALFLRYITAIRILDYGFSFYSGIHAKHAFFSSSLKKSFADFSFAMNMASKVSISDWFSDRNVLVTGGTGFMGKILISKLLLSCPDIGNIFIIIRKKKDVEPQARWHLILQVLRRAKRRRKKERKKESSRSKFRAFLITKEGIASYIFETIEAIARVSSRKISKDHNREGKVEGEPIWARNEENSTPWEEKSLNLSLNIIYVKHRCRQKCGLFAVLTRNENMAA